MQKPSSPPKPVPLFRLTLSVEAFTLALAKSKPLAGKVAYSRPDGRWDVGISVSAADQLMQMAEPKENLSDTVIRLLSAPTQVTLSQVAVFPKLPNGKEGV
jgi:hypothetical protein